MSKAKVSRHSVTEMFDRISPTYDRLNRILSLGIDQRWRRKMRKFLPKHQNQTVVDLATGTGDQILALESHPSIGKLIGFDLSQKMLSIGKEKVKERAELRLGSALNIPLSDEIADCTTISFGIRNVTNPEKCLLEMHRILKPHGRAMILEFSKPTLRPIRFCYLLYLRHILPRIGRLFSKDPTAYIYLNQTIEEFPSGSEFTALMEKAGFKQIKQVPMCMGAVSLYIGDKE